jgi:tRNA threonylcarbamoyladenosine biosynthesis protein TsaE
MRTLARSAAETEAVGAALARALPATPPLTVLALTGELGAGKTTLVRGLLRALGFTAAVRSPTYTLVELYPLKALTVVHADLYRLREPAELDLLGLREWAQPGFLWCIEWPERGGGRLPTPDVTLSLAVTPAAHAITGAAASTAGREWLAAAGLADRQR